MYRNYPELKKEVLAHSNKTESERAEREFALFEKRNWQEYVLLLANVLSELRTEEFRFLRFEKTAVDSYVLFKATQKDQVNEKLLLDQKSFEILSHDALRLDLTLVGLLDLCGDKVYKIGRILEDGIKGSRLNYYESMLPFEREDDKGEYIVVSNTVLNEEDLQTIRNEKKQSDEKETDLLRKCLLIKYRCLNRL